MNILYISYDGALDPLGSSQILPYLKGLSIKGINITLLTFEKSKNLNRKLKLKEAREELSSFGIHWIYLRYHNKPMVLGALYDIFNGIVRSIGIMRLRRIEIVHARSYISSIIAFFLKKMFKIKFIFDMRGLWPDEKVDAGAWKNGLIYKTIKNLEKKFFKYADEVVVLTYAGKKLLQNARISDGRISVVPTCTDLNLFKKNTQDKNITKEIGKNGRFVFVYLGSLGSWYMLREMIDFFKESRQVLNEPLFLLLLNNASQDMVNCAIAERGISHSDYFVKDIDYRDVRDYLSIADASIFFIKPVTSKAFSCPTKLGESLACGIPVIINSGIGDTEDIVRKERVGVVVRKFTKEAYRKALDELKVLLGEGDLLSQRCRLVAEKFFSLNEGINKYQEIYQRLSKV